ncbi:MULTISPECIES: sigma-70 family RNA polymerase sigma factor [Rhodomicrobium]|uniref:sigma-70 family RNA polymerase sigma factor n=1 Tax=Rhodomicrobium TaxID=1068 RepID=UPI001FDAC255|nr:MULTISPECIES: sigma-70 family RNA polymerase sigma factor [Rhodomicrobium]
MPGPNVLPKEPVAGSLSAPDEDAALAARVAKGDRDAYAALVRRHLPRVLAVTRRMLGNEALAEEAAQEALLRLWTHAASYDPAKARLTTWLTRITANLSLDRLRKRDEEAWPENFDVALPARQEQDYMQGQVAEKVNAALQTLPERQRLALILCHYEELSMAEAAAVMETTAEAVESLLSRARRSLRRQLEPEWRMLLTEDDAI